MKQGTKGEAPKCYLGRVMPKRTQVAVEDEIKRLQKFISDMERKYHMSSDEMAKAAWADHSLDTPEVASWLISHRTLKGMQKRKSEREAGRTTGTLSQAT